ncbi:MAG: CotH kinase family protein, partial [Cyclobacteriaceae bacterium]|nr:CotH kinase family protein [Cyclobacteriaceae bacterium]
LTGRFEYIPYDADNSFGIDWIGEDWASRDIYQWSNRNEPRPLYERLLQIPVYKDRLTYYIQKLIDGPLQAENIRSRIDAQKEMIRPYALADTYRTLDWGFDDSDFDESFRHGLGGHVAYGLHEFILKRTTTALGQLRHGDIAPIVWSVERTQFQSDTPFSFYSKIEDESTIQAVLYYQIDQNEFLALPLNDRGIDGDTLKGDFVFSGKMTEKPPFTTLSYYLMAQDSTGQKTRYPVSGFLTFYYSPAKIPELYINEVMSLNTYTIRDELDQYDDWLEIYNGGDTPIWLGDKYLSDDTLRKDKWKIPDIVLPPNEYLTFWADEDMGQGSLHTNFKLAKTGESIGLYFGEEHGYARIDQVHFPTSQANQSFGRIPNGLGDFQLLPWPTPGRSNTSPYLGLAGKAPAVHLYPNPFYHYLHVIPTGPAIQQITISDLSGRQVLEMEKPLFPLFLETLVPGIYLIRLSFGQHSADTYLRMIKQ